VALIGDQERERAAEQLRRHFVHGRLSVEELTDRLGVALAARRRSEVRVALAELPSTWREQARRALVLVAIWLAWWTASLVLLVGFVATVVIHGLTLTGVVLFPALWLACTLAAIRTARRGRPARRQLQRFG
jgi:hypothetical protein